jgi:hypothetical protein
MNYRDAAMALVEDGIISSHALLIAALKYMSQDDVLDLLQCNELAQYIDQSH